MSSRLGTNPLSQSIFSPTTSEKEKKFEIEKVEKFEIKKEEKPAIQKPENGNQKAESVNVQYDKVTVRLPIELNDWLDEVIRKTKRTHGSKIPKEVLIQIALEAFKAKDIDWSSIKDENDLKKALNSL